MANTANKAQKFLLDNNCGDLILNDRIGIKPEDRIYASDIMMMFIESERGKKVDTGEGQLTIPDVIKSVCENCENKFLCEKHGVLGINCIRLNSEQTVL